MKPLTALFIGRFQPIHKGHLNVIKDLLKKYRKVVIVIGSTNRSGKENPFSFKERKTMLNAILRGYKNSCKIIGIADTKSDRKWRESILRKAKFDVLVTGNPWTRRCFNGYRVIKPRKLNPSLYNATRIRKLLTGNKWEPYVPRHAVPIIKKHFLNDFTK